MKKAVLISAIALIAAAATSQAAIIISEVDPTGSSTTTYGADWFELTNTGPAAVNISGWKVDDNSNSFANAVALRGITSIPAGKSVVFIEGNTSGSSDPTVQANFKTAWFGVNVPVGFMIGGYGGSGIGLSSTADAVNIYDSAGTKVAGVTFGASTTGVTFDNAAGTDGAISTLSENGADGAFVNASGETGSPGAVPEPVVLGFGAVVSVLLGIRCRRY